MKIKKDADYFELLSKMVACTHEAARKLHELVVVYDQVPERCGEIHDIEHACDDLLHILLKRLNAAFITPIDREDLLAIGKGIDDITDAIEDAANAFDMLCVDTIRPGAVEMAELILQAMEALVKAVGEFDQFKNSQKLSTYIVEVNSIEAKGDTLHRHLVKDLFHRGDPLTILQWKEIFDIMEQVLDAGEEVADLLEAMAMKNR